MLFCSSSISKKILALKTVTFPEYATRTTEHDTTEHYTTKTTWAPPTTSDMEPETTPATASPYDPNETPVIIVAAVAGVLIGNTSYNNIILIEH